MLAFAGLTGRWAASCPPGTTWRWIRSSRWENPFVERFNGRAHEQLLNIEEFGTLVEAKVVIEA